MQQNHFSFVNNYLHNVCTETIWQTGISLCEDIQETHRTNGLQHLYVHLWRQRFGKTAASAFEKIIHHIPECFQFT